MNTRFIFVRHAEAEKNITDIVGGRGTGLTEKGKEQIKLLIPKLINYFDNRELRLYSAPLLQAKETAKYVGTSLNIKVNVTEKLAPSDMGVLTGLSEEEIKERYPKEYELLIKWRRKEIEVSEFKIPQMKEPALFWNQIMAFLKSNQNGGINIVICTRSVLVLIANYLAGNTPTLGGNYRHVDIENCEFFVFDCLCNGEVSRVI